MSDWNEFWGAYRKKTGKLTWRVAKSADTFEIDRLRLASERFLGQPQRRPDLFKFPVMLALVAENEAGEIVDAVYVETQVEVIKMGCSAEGFEESAELEADLGAWLKDLKFGTAIATCPTRLYRRMRPVFERLGFELSDDGLIRWKRRL